MGTHPKYVKLTHWFFLLIVLYISSINLDTPVSRKKCLFTHSNQSVLLKMKLFNHVRIIRNYRVALSRPSAPGRISKGFLAHDYDCGLQYVVSYFHDGTFKLTTSRHWNWSSRVESFNSLFISQFNSRAITNFQFRFQFNSEFNPQFQINST